MEWDDLTNLEEIQYKLGADVAQTDENEQYIEAKEEGKREGFMRGYAIGLEVGFLSYLVPPQTSEPSQTKDTVGSVLDDSHLNNLREKIDSFPSKNDSSVDFKDEVDAIKNIYNILHKPLGDTPITTNVALLSQKPSTQQSSSLSYDW